MFFSTITGGGMMFGGPPPTGSSVGWAFTRYMAEHGGEWEHDPYSPTSRSEFVWTGRRLRVRLADGRWAAATVLELGQFNVGPFSPVTRWCIKLQYDDATTATALGGEDGVVRHELCKCSVVGGGTFEGERAFPKMSFEWTSPPTPPLAPAATEEAAVLPALPTLADLEERKAAASTRFERAVALLRDDLTEEEQQERDEILTDAFAELVELGEAIPEGPSALQSEEMEALLEALLTWPAQVISIDGVLHQLVAGRYRSVEQCLAYAVALPARTADIAAGSFLPPGCDPANWVKRKQNMCFHNIAEQLEGEGQLERAEVWYRRAIACCLEAYDAQKEAHAAATDIGNLAVCLRKMDRLAEALAEYDRSLAMHRSGTVENNRRRCLEVMADWTGTSGEYADALGR